MGMPTMPAATVNSRERGNAGAWNTLTACGSAASSSIRSARRSAMQRAAGPRRTRHATAGELRHRTDRGAKHQLVALDQRDPSTRQAQPFASQAKKKRALYPPGAVAV